MLGALALFTAIDYVTGFLAADKEGKLSSKVGRWGIARKVVMFLVVAVAYQLDQVLGDGTVLHSCQWPTATISILGLTYPRRQILTQIVSTPSSISLNYFNRKGG